MPVGAYGGRREIMEQVAPLGPVYQAGTLSGNPVAMAAGFTQLDILKRDPGIYIRLREAGEYFFGGLERLLRKAGLPYTVNYTGSLGCLFFTDRRVTDDEGAKTSDTLAYAAYCNYMLSHGVYLAPSQFEAMFLSAAHTKEQLDETLQAAEAYFMKLKGQSPA